MVGIPLDFRIHTLIFSTLVIADLAFYSHKTHLEKQADKFKKQAGRANSA